MLLLKVIISLVQIPADKMEHCQPTPRVGKRCTCVEGSVDAKYRALRSDGASSMVARQVLGAASALLRHKLRNIRWLGLLLLLSAICAALYAICNIALYTNDGGQKTLASKLAEVLTVNSHPTKYAVYRRETHGLKNEFPNPVGSVWPLPQVHRSSDACLQLRAQEFSFQATDETCDILEAAFYRYHQLIFNPPRLLRVKLAVDATLGNDARDENVSLLRSLQVSLKNPCETWPSSNMDEKYELKIDTADLPGEALLSSESVWGILRGLETFSQLIYLNERGEFQVNGSHIIDFPRFGHRGIMLDTARHYIPKKIIMENLDAMAQNKFNVFHWHIVDDQSFPYQSKAFPLLSQKGSYNPQTHVYTAEDIAEIVEFARLRGIRVIPEFDTPGHTKAWGKSLPELLTPCYTKNGTQFTGHYGPFNPALNITFQTLKTFFAEVLDVFPDKYIHLGGDEVDFDCWVTNPQITALRRKMSYGMLQLQEYYIQRLMDTFPDNISFILWHDAFTYWARYNTDKTIIQVWTPSYRPKLETVTNSGYRAILSSCWYLDHTRNLYFSDWDKLYDCEPLDFEGTPNQTSLVIGGEACMWAEAVDRTNLITRIWPRASAVAERLWSARLVNNATLALPRLAEHRCRMLYRGINAEPQHGLNYCNVDFKRF